MSSRNDVSQLCSPVQYDTDVVFLGASGRQGWNRQLGGVDKGGVGEVFWCRNTYASWHVPHEGPCSHHCAHWDDNFHILQSIWGCLKRSARAVHAQCNYLGFWP